LQVGAITSFQAAVHEQDPSNRVFSRDLLEVEIWDNSRTQLLFTLYVNHLKSHFGDEDDGGQGKTENDTRRRRQAEMISRIAGTRMQAGSRYIILGDMNDPPDAAPLADMRTVAGQEMLNALTNPQETRPAKNEANGNTPATAAWTHRFKPDGQPPEHELFDQIC
jgi:hypothetical protein